MSPHSGQSLWVCKVALFLGSEEVVLESPVSAQRRSGEACRECAGTGESSGPSAPRVADPQLPALAGAWPVPWPWLGWALSPVLPRAKALPLWALLSSSGLGSPNVPARTWVTLCDGGGAFGAGAEGI